MSTYHFTQHHALIVEPNRQLAIPYMYLPSSFTVKTVATLTAAAHEIEHSPPTLVLLSTSFDPYKTLHFLELLKNASASQFIHLVLVVDWSKKLTHLLGTSWGGNIGLSHSLASQDEVLALLERIMSD